jgi:hypothetical protein
MNMVNFGAMDAAQGPKVALIVIFTEKTDTNTL